VTDNLGFQITLLFKGKSQNCIHRESYHRTLIENHGDGAGYQMVPVSVTSSDL